ncbi:hypothetical protein PanWU01x14_286040, partial [Parasponia andersonii]
HTGLALILLQKETVIKYYKQTDQTVRSRDRIYIDPGHSQPITYNLQTTKIKLTLSQHLHTFFLCFFYGSKHIMHHTHTHKYIHTHRHTHIYIYIYIYFTI